MVSLRQAGQGKVGCVLWILLFAVAGLVAYKTIPVKVASSKLHDFMVEQARHEQAMRVGRRSDAIQTAIFNRANELDLPVAKEQIRVSKDQSRIIMEVSFTVPVEFPGYTYHWRFNYVVNRPLFVV
jgi:hypothetical protein